MPRKLKARGIRGPRSAVRPGLIIWDALADQGPMTYTDLYHAYKEKVETSGQNRAPMSYQSFLTVARMLRLAGLIRRTGETRPAEPPQEESQGALLGMSLPLRQGANGTAATLVFRGREQKRRIMPAVARYLDLTDKGRGQRDAFADPRMAYRLAVGLEVVLPEAPEVPTRETPDLWDDLVEKIRHLPQRRPSQVERMLTDFVERHGLDPTLIDDALDRLTEYRETRREDFETRAEYEDAREELWNEMLDALEGVDIG